MAQIESVASLASGTVNVGTGVSSGATTSFGAQGKGRNRLLVVFHNASGQAVSSVDVIAQTTSFGAHNGVTKIVTAKAVNGGANGAEGSVAFAIENGDPFLFALGQIEINFNLGANTVANGSIDYEVLAY